MTEYQFFIAYGIDYSIDEIRFIEEKIDQGHREVKYSLLKKQERTENE